MTEGDIKHRLQDLLRHHPDMPRTEMAELLGVSRKTFYKHLGRLGSVSEPGAEPPSTANADTAQGENGGISQKKAMHPHDGRRQNKGTPPPGPHSTGFKPENEVAVKTGEFRNPSLRDMPPEDVAAIKGQRDLSPLDLQRQTVELWDVSILDMNRRLAHLQREKKQLLTVEATYIRQEGDGEVAGTFRQAKRRRQRVDDRIIEVHESIARVHAKRDAAVARLYEMVKGAPPEDVNSGLKALAANIKASTELLAKQKQQSD